MSLQSITRTLAQLLLAFLLGLPTLAQPQTPAITVDGLPGAW